MRSLTRVLFFETASSPLPLLATLLAAVALSAGARAQALDPSNPSTPQKLVFVHHSTGENWLGDGNGGLGLALRNANYFVSDTNYGWGPDDLDAGWGTIGDHTDIGNYYSWFIGSHSGTYLAALLTESGQHSSYSRLASDPGGTNRIILFKSCFPNSNLQGATTDPVPPIDSNPLRHQDAYSEYHTFANAKGIYQSLLGSFAARQDKLFILVTSPPLVTAATSAEAAALARSLNDWLVTGWLAGYPYRNVFVFDFFNVLTSDGGPSRTDDPDTNDLGWADGNHHRYRNALVQHTRTVSNNVSAYGSSSDDSHPSQAGSLKATGEFVSLLNIAYHCWQGTGGCPPVGPTSPGSLLQPLTPCRVLDTRNAAGPLGGPVLAASSDRTFPVSTSACGIPADARALSINVTAVSAAAAGDILIFPGHVSEPGPPSTVAFSAGRTRAAMTIVGLAADGTGTLKARNRSTGTVHLVVDVNGYFR